MVAEARVSSEDETVSRDSEEEVREADWADNEEDIEPKNDDSWAEIGVEIDPRELNTMSRESEMDRDAPVRYSASKVEGEEVAEARASKEDETVRREAEKREDEPTSVNEEEIEPKNVDNWVEIDPSELNDTSTEFEWWKVKRRKSWMDRDAPVR